MKIFYWSPFLSNIATVDSVVNSIKSIKKFDKKKEINPYIIDATGEWSEKSDKLKNFQIIKLYKDKFFNSLPKGGYLKSRFSQFLIFILNFTKLKKLIKKEKPDFFIAHLIISLPLFLFSIFNFDSKLIIRISGTPKLNFFRKIYWTFFSKKVFIVTCPTISTLNSLKKMNIFPEEKLKILYDPIIYVNKIQNDKKELIEDKFQNKKFILGVGRLTKQKNFNLLINFFSEINKVYPDLILIIVGEGEQRLNLERKIKMKKLEDKIFLIGYKKNVFNYIMQSECFISSSFYEDPGFALIEAGFLNKIVFAADSNTGPSEILDNSNRGFLYKNNNSMSLIENFLIFKKMNKENLNLKRKNLKKYCRNYSLFSHYKKLRDILFN
tara:strand:+ start:6436 stop:7578 length:1143 start_codon:yes stop_codon:yes gene_type:complete